MLRRCPLSKLTPVSPLVQRLEMHLTLVRDDGLVVALDGATFLSGMKLHSVCCKERNLYEKKSCRRKHDKHLRNLCMVINFLFLYRAS